MIISSFSPEAMTSSLIDPRPLEPNWVTSSRPGLPDRAEWTVVRQRWNRETRQYDTTTVSGDGNALAFMTVLAAILNSRDFECQITVDASGIIPDDDVRKLPNLKYPSGYDLCLFWSINPVLGEEETGTCTDELFSWVEYLLNEQKAFEIELSLDDPTP